MDNLYIVMPAYNEEDNIESVVRAWYPVMFEKTGGVAISYRRQWKYR